MISSNNCNLKIKFQSLFLIWCMPPWKGATAIHNYLLRPFFKDYESIIDKALYVGKDRTKSKFSHQVFLVMCDPFVNEL